MKRSACIVLLAAFALVVTACGDSEGGGTTQAAPEVTKTTMTKPPPTTVAGSTTSTTQPTAAPGEPIGAIADARAAVVQIVGRGTFIDPFEGVQANVPGAGSGFIIDPSGLAVTNNHVVTGSALLEVFLDGEDRPRNASVIGVSECSDLAVIDIQGDGFPYFEWYDGEITAGLEIFAAGYPLGDPEYTLLDGIVSKEDAAGETNWASVDAVIEHSADTLPGNSGGPILTADGKIVAVNYAGNNVGQSFAIGREIARPVVAQLAAGENVDSIGVNGEALLAGGFSGIWVYSVQSGGPADLAGVAAGDLIFNMEGLDLALDGTMAEYCDILRSHQPDDTLSIGVYRNATDEILEGQLNGRLLAAAGGFTTDLGGVVDTPTVVAGDEYTDFYEATDDTGAITVRVPVEWSDTLGLNWEYEGTLVGPALSAAPDVAGFTGSWGTPGVFIAASEQLPVSRLELLDNQDFSDSCTFVERLPYDDGVYFGDFDVWENCGGLPTTFVAIAAEPADGQFIVLVQVQLVEDRDFGVLDSIINSFLVNPGLGGYAAGGGDTGGDGGGLVQGELLPSGLLCRDLADLGFWYGDAAAYWVREGRPDRMDADLNGIPCETVYDGDQIDAFYFAWLQEPSGLFCRDLAALGYFWGDALAYWIAEGAPDRMDADVNGIPCETVYDTFEIDPFLYFEFVQAAG